MDNHIKLLREDLKKLETLQQDLSQMVQAWKQPLLCGCGEPLFLHASGTYECPSCEIF